MPGAGPLISFAAPRSSVGASSAVGDPMDARCGCGGRCDSGCHRGGDTGPSHACARCVTRLLLGGPLLGRRHIRDRAGIHESGPTEALPQSGQPGSRELRSRGWRKGALRPENRRGLPDRLRDLALRYGHRVLQKQLLRCSCGRGRLIPCHALCAALCRRAGAQCGGVSGRDGRFRPYSGRRSFPRADAVRRGPLVGRRALPGRFPPLRLLLLPRLRLSQRELVQELTL